MPFIEYKGKRVLYIHVPKTGGGSVETWMSQFAPLRLFSIGLPPTQKCTPQHLRMSDIRGLLGDDYFDHVFMTVRNPYDRIVSEYRMRAALEGSGFWKAWPTFSLWLEKSFDKYRQNPFLFDNHLRPQWEFLGSKVQILKFESGMENILSKIADKLEVEFDGPIPHRHSTGDDRIHVELDAVDCLRIKEFYGRDFDTFGYDTADYGEVGAPKP